MSTTHKPIVRINGREVEGITDLTTTITQMPDGRHRYEVDIVTHDVVPLTDAQIDAIADRLLDRFAQDMSAALRPEAVHIDEEALGL